ncbi:MAG: flagellar hook-length control protein FliK, partial [Methylobacter sp.]
MDINSPINAQSLLASSRLSENTLNLKVGQQLDVKVINADIQAAKNAITLSLGGKDVTVQSNQPIALNAGQDLKIQVTQVAPVVEFKVLDPLNQAAELRLKLIPTV